MADSSTARKFVYVSTLDSWNDSSAQIMNENGVYYKSIVFRADTNEIYNRGKIYGESSAEKHATDASIIDALHYNTSFGDLTTPSAVGGIAKGTKASDLNGKKIDEMLNMLLFPEINPTITAPSGSTKFMSGFENGGLYEVNATLPQESNLGYNFNRGKITCPGLSDKYRAGAATGATYTVSGKATSFATTKFEEGTYTYVATISFDEGDEALTSYSNHAEKDVNGNVFTNPLAAGSLNGSSVCVKGVYPIYASSSTVGTLTKQALTLSKSDVALEMVAGASQQFAVKGTVTKILEYNSVSGKYDIDKTNAYTKVASTQKSGGEDVSGYNTYTRNDASGDPVKVQITFS